MRYFTSYLKKVILLRSSHYLRALPPKLLTSVLINASLSDRDRSRFSGDRDQYIKENTEVIRQSYILNDNG